MKAWPQRKKAAGKEKTEVELANISDFIFVTAETQRRGVLDRRNRIFRIFFREISGFVNSVNSVLISLSGGFHVFPCRFGSLSAS
jgi:hypothetical protein